jgi:hypothetical protein
MRGCLLGLVLLVGCGSDPVQKSTVKLTTSKGSISIEKLKVDLVYEVEQNKKEIESIDEELTTELTDSYEANMAEYETVESVIQEKHKSAWPVEIHEVDSIISTWNEEDFEAMRSLIDQEVKRRCDDFSYEGFKNKEEAEKAEIVSCEAHDKQVKTAWDTIQQAREEKISLLSKDFIELMEKHKQKQLEMNAETRKALDHAYAKVRSERKEIKDEFELRIKDVKAVQKQRENDLKDRIHAMEQKPH